MRTLLCSIAVFALLSPDAVARISFNVDLEKNSCATLSSALSETEAGLAAIATCEEVAAGVIETSGNYPYWLGCLNYDEMHLEGHMARCVMLSERVLEEPIGESCEEILGVYENGLRATSRSNALPSNYSRPSCENVTAAALIWKGTRPGWIRCQGYDRSQERAHAGLCLFGVPKLDTLDSCGDVQRTYEERLRAAYGALPPGYRLLRCSNATEIVEKAKEELASIRSERRRASSAVARQRARSVRAANPLTIEQVMLGLIALKMDFDMRLAHLDVPDTNEIRERANQAANRIQDEGIAVIEDVTLDSLTEAEQKSFIEDIGSSPAEVQTSLRTHEAMF